MDLVQAHIRHAGDACLRRIYATRPRDEWRRYASGADSGDLPLQQGHPMGAFLLWLLIAGIGAYLLVAMLRPDKF